MVAVRLGGCHTPPESQSSISRSYSFVQLSFRRRNPRRAKISSQKSADGMSASSRDAVNFPIRLLELANQCQPEADMPSFSKLARMVGRMKEPYNDQM